jgi:hypothetical protein
MLALTAANLVGVVLFAMVYAVSGAGYLSQAAFLACLVVLFALVTALWVRTEARHRALHPLQRLGRVAFGLVAVAIATPGLALMPLFWLESRLPPEAGLQRVLAPTMAVLLITLVLVTLVNVIGGAVAVGRTLTGRRRLRPRG